MKHDAEENADEDKRRFELVEARNQADQMCYQLEKLIKENSDKLSDSDKEPLQKAIETVREAAKGEDTQAIKSAVSELEQASHAFSKVLYESQAAEQAAGGGDAADASQAAASAADDDAIDAEFEVKE